MHKRGLTGPSRADILFGTMLYSHALIPYLHGAAGILDELLLFGAPLAVVIIILTIASRRARKKAPRQERPPRDVSSRPPHSRE
jgi:hypothetical protein